MLGQDLDIPLSRKEAALVITALARSARAVHRLPWERRGRMEILTFKRYTENGNEACEYRSSEEESWKEAHGL